MASYQSFAVSREDLTFEACLERFKSALERAARAGYVVKYEHNTRVVEVWHSAVWGRPTEAFGAIYVMTAESSVTRLKYLIINRAVLERATIEQPTPLLLTASAIDRAVLFAANRPSYVVELPGYGEVVSRTFAQVERRGRLYTVPALDGAANSSASFARWSRRLLKPSVTAILFAGVSVGVCLSDLVQSGILTLSS